MHILGRKRFWEASLRIWNFALLGDGPITLKTIFFDSLTRLASVLFVHSQIHIGIDALTFDFSGYPTTAGFYDQRMFIYRIFQLRRFPSGPETFIGPSFTRPRFCSSRHDLRLTRLQLKLHFLDRCEKKFACNAHDRHNRCEKKTPIEAMEFDAEIPFHRIFRVSSFPSGSQSKLGFPEVESVA